METMMKWNGGLHRNVGGKRTSTEDHVVMMLSVTVQGLDLIFSIIHLSPLISDCPLTFTVSIMFFSDSY